MPPPDCGPAPLGHPGCHVSHDPTPPLTSTLPPPTAAGGGLGDAGGARPPGGLAEEPVQPGPLRQLSLAIQAGARRRPRLLLGVSALGAWLAPVAIGAHLMLRPDPDPLAALGLQLAAGAAGLAVAALALRAHLAEVRRQAEAAVQARQAWQMQRQQAQFDEHARQLDALRRLAHTDALTGLCNRSHFLAQLDERLRGSQAAPGVGLLLVRLRDLAGLNRRMGHGSVDRLIRAVAQALAIYPQRIEACCAGRLNGADFGLLLPAGGLADETAGSLHAALQGPLSRIDPQAQVAIGAVELQRTQVPHASAALALADAALAEAELHGGVYRAPHADTGDIGEALGEVAWLRRISRALDLGHVALGEYPVCTPDGRRLHLDCPLRLQLNPDGPLEPAQRWLSLAVRSRLSAQVDDQALMMALAAIARDGVPRCVNLSAQALGMPEFVAAVTQRLEAAPDAACRLWIDLPEALAVERPLLVRELSRRWRPLGAMLGLEHAGEALMRVPRLIDLGLDCVRIDGRFVNGLADPAAGASRRYLAGLVRLVQGVGLLVTAEGVRDAEDLDVLWQLGFDAASGPALQTADGSVDIELPLDAGGATLVAARMDRPPDLLPGQTAGSAPELASGLTTGSAPRTAAASAARATAAAPELHV